VVCIVQRISGQKSKQLGKHRIGQRRSGEETRPRRQFRIELRIYLVTLREYLTSCHKWIAYLLRLVTGHVMGFQHDLGDGILLLLE
jgi:hypothetical protein